MPSQALTRPLMLVIRSLQWASAVIVMGLTSYFISKGPRGQHLIYQEVISVISVVFFLPAFLSPFMPRILSRFVFFIDVVFSYLWLTAFIFAAQDYNWRNCYFNSPPFMGCGRKRANEAFIFLALIKLMRIPSIFTFFGMLLELYSLWSYRRENATPVIEKHPPHDGPAAPHDGPVTSVP
ncbi:membrane-associating domain-containing protein [Aspergillus cavernicola]|uniref:Membrane-associating domain-containing protein n=1 Tax=Aspergillus cavernicola TaxID=176166 RepID=A0ABR4J0F2_9EURO